MTMTSVTLSTAGWAVALCLLSTWVFVMVLGPSRMFRDTVVEHAYVGLTETGPRALERAVRTTLGNPVAEHSKRLVHRLFGQRNPVFLIITVALYLGGLGVFVSQATTHIPNRYLGAYHWVAIVPVISASMFSYAMACMSDPGIVTKANVGAACRRFPYDNLLFFRKDCRTCRMAKPARSKHCSVCGCCVEMADHHCVWINNCVGLGNVRWFVLFLVSFSTVCVYGAVVLGTVVLELRHVHGLDSIAVWDADAGMNVALPLRRSLLVLAHMHGALCGLAILLALLSPMVVVFSAYQLWILMCGYTGNEES
ncbi:palmitoyltransferase swf1, partial [Linderina pennispora]